MDDKPVGRRYGGVFQLRLRLRNSTRGIYVLYLRGDRLFFGTSRSGAEDGGLRKEKRRRGKKKKGGLHRGFICRSRRGGIRFVFRQPFFGTVS